MKKTKAPPLTADKWLSMYEALMKEHNKLKKEFEQYKRESVKWSVEDFKEMADEMEYFISDKRAQQALEQMIKKHDAELGISWDTVRDYVREYGELPEPPEQHDIDTSREEAEFRARQDGSWRG